MFAVTDRRQMSDVCDHPAANVRVRDHPAANVRVRDLPAAEVRRLRGRPLPGGN